MPSPLLVAIHQRKEKGNSTNSWSEGEDAFYDPTRKPPVSANTITRALFSSFPRFDFDEKLGYTHTQKSSFYFRLKLTTSFFFFYWVSMWWTRTRILAAGLIPNGSWLEMLIKKIIIKKKDRLSLFLSLFFGAGKQLWPVFFFFPFMKSYKSAQGNWPKLGKVQKWMRSFFFFFLLLHDHYWALVFPISPLHLPFPKERESFEAAISATTIKRRNNNNNNNICRVQIFFFQQQKK